MTTILSGLIAVIAIAVFFGSLRAPKTSPMITVEPSEPAPVEEVEAAPAAPAEPSLAERIRAIAEHYEADLKFKDEALRKQGALLYRVIEQTGSKTVTVPKDWPEHAMVMMSEEGDKMKLTIGEWNPQPIELK